ncbi:hypothetical protein LZK76_02400 [Rhizobium leguminosarum]|nr:hypothetical protein LZK76_02400 [Rhizobium leguminosarum]
MTSPHWKRFAWFCLCLTLSHPAWSAGGIEIPGYAPAMGVERSYRVQKATETDMSFWFDKPGASAMTMRGAFRQRMTVVSRDEDGMRVRWSLSADLPEGIAGLADSYQMNPLYRNSLTAYGTAALELETDLNGNPRDLSGVDQIVAHVREMAANGPGGVPVTGESGLYDIIAKIEANPLQIVVALVPEAATACHRAILSGGDHGDWSGFDDLARRRLCRRQCPGDVDLDTGIDRRNRTHGNPFAVGGS